MRILVAASPLFVAITAFARICFAVPPVPTNEKPLYGGLPKTQAEKVLDEKFVKEATQAAGTRAKAASEISKRGWDAIQQGDPLTAIRRFNQATLLQPPTGEVYWGLAIASSMQGNSDLSSELFDKAAQLEPTNPRILCDYGHALVQRALELFRSEGVASKGALEKISRAESLYERATVLDPKSALPYSRIAMASFYRGDLLKTQEAITQAEKRGGEGLDPRFLEAVKHAIASKPSK